MKRLKLGVLGDGGWGTTLAILLHQKGFEVSLWGAFPEYIRQVEKTRVNDKFLPGVTIPRAIRLTADMQEAAAEKDVIVFAVPSEYLRGVLKKFKQCRFSRAGVFVSVSKGIETLSLKRMSEVIHEELGAVHLGVLSGPTITREVVSGKPTTAIIASRNLKVRRHLQDIFISGNFRIYTCADVVGVELGGSLKNVIAIACGICDGLELGSNAKAGLLSRGLAEMSRLGLAMGAEAKTFSGISGLGDLVTTCFSPYSRNRFVGEQVAKGKSLASIRNSMQMVAEGVPTTKSAFALARKHRVAMPITEQVYGVLYKHKSVFRAVKDLMSRQRKEE